MFYLLAVFIIIVLIDLPNLIRKKDIKMIIIYGCFYVTAIVLSLAIVFDLSVTSPMVLADSFIRNVLHLSY
ncbi:MAG TPA: hypothetical protein DEB10_10855 [Ruminococcaceae bacterium]|jgi:hypothetical protein|nr:hypothetical protein [Oscillospiraceae bacterium]